MPAPRKVSMIQLTVLLTYLEKHKDIKLGTAVAMGKLGQKRQEEHWEKIAKILNKCPGTPRTALKWKHYWNEKKSNCRKKASKGLELLPFEKRVMALVGPIQKDEHGFSVLNYVVTRNETKEEKHKENDLESDTYHQFESPSEHLEQEQEAEGTMPEYTNNDAPDPMPMMEVITNGYSYNSEEEERLEEEIEPVEEDRKPQLNNSEAEVPDWVRRVEHTRLQYEERTTQAIEKMSDAVTNMAGAMQTMVASLNMIEAAIRSNNNRKCVCQNTRVYSS